jgi:hypothetical protein
VPAARTSLVVDNDKVIVTPAAETVAEASMGVKLACAGVSFGSLSWCGPSLSGPGWALRSGRLRG